MTDPDSDEEAEDQDRRAVESAEDVEDAPDGSHAVEDADAAPEEVPKEPKPSEEESEEGTKGTGRRMFRSAAGAAARLAYEHRNELVAALALLKEQEAVSDTEEDSILEAYEAADEKTRGVIEELVERLERAKFGKVVIGIREPDQEGAEPGATDPAGGEAQPPRASKPDEPRRGTGGSAAAAGATSPTGATIEGAGKQLEQTGRRVARSVGQEMRGQGEIIVEDLVKQGRRALLQDETKDMERVFFKWTTETITTLEQILVRGLVGAGVVLIVVAILWSAHQVEALQDIVRFASVFLLVFTGILLITWSNRVAEWAHESRKEVEDLVESGPSERLHRMLGDDFAGVRRPKESGGASGPSAPKSSSGEPPSAK